MADAAMSKEWTLPGELWLPVVGWEDLYKVSDLGRVMTLPRVVPNGVGHRRVSRRILRQATRVGGYKFVNLKTAPRYRVVSVHILVAEAFIGARPPGLECCHNDGDPSNNRLSNLRYDTPSGNAYDRTRHGTNHKAAQVTCSRGHLLEMPNLTPWHPHRECLACSRAHSLNKYYRSKGAPFDIDAVADRYYAEIMKDVA